MKVELSKRELDIIQQQEAFLPKEEQRMKKDEACEQKEEEYKAREPLFNEWERIQLNIMEVSRAMANETNEILKHDMQSDIHVLLNRKNLLADM